MKIAHGIDLVWITSMETMLGKLLWAFTLAEREECDGREERVAAYAKRFAAKEACLKALGVNDRVGGVLLSEIEVLLTDSRRPVLRLSGGALAQLAAIAPGGLIDMQVSIADDGPMAVASVIIVIA